MAVPVAASILGALLLGGTAALTVAQAWAAGPQPTADATYVLGGLLVALLVAASFGVATRARQLGPVSAAAALALAAHGGSLVFQGEAVGALFLGLAPVVAALVHLAFLPTPIARIPHTSGRIDIACAIAKCRQETAHAAQRAASPSHLAMHA